MTHEDKLRAWAKGGNTFEAGTELLIRASGGRFARPDQPWIHSDEEQGISWIDFASIPFLVGGLSLEEQGLVIVAASIAGDVPVVLGVVLPGLDRKMLQLVLAALSHAAGGHEYSDLVDNADGTLSFMPLPSLYPWPDEA